MERQTDAADPLEQFCGSIPRLRYTVDALYWLGRSTSAPAICLRRAPFTRRPSSVSRRPILASTPSQRLRANRFVAADSRGFSFGDSSGPALDRACRPACRLRRIDRWNRAQALESIAFDNSAELELRAAYADTHAPQLLLAVAEAAVEAGHYRCGHRRHAASRSAARSAALRRCSGRRLAHRLSAALSRLRSSAKRSAIIWIPCSIAGSDPAGVGLCQRRRFPLAMPWG